MKVAIEGCCHGELDKIYETLQFLEQANKYKVDVLLICGDFQAVRNKDDLNAMAVPQKYQKLNTFYKYYSGEKVAPVLTIFIGGNHEASNYMQELPYGGWVAKNIYYMGYANVIQVGDLRIGGLSGIFKGKDYNRGHFEMAPYDGDSKRSVYHIRSLEVFRLKQLTRHVDLFMTHDWPSDIARYGPVEHLFRRKPFLKEEILNGSLGSPPAAELLHKLQPSYWFSAHLHVKYTACVQHTTEKSTRFLSLDKCLPRRQFLQVVDFPDKKPLTGPVKIRLDPEWLCILKATNHLLNLERFPTYMPGPGGRDRYNFEVSDKDITDMQEVFGGDLTLPENFEITAPTLQQRNFKPSGPPVRVNPQTSLLCTMLDVTDPNAVYLGVSSQDTMAQHLSSTTDTLDIQDPDTDDEPPSDVSSSLDTSFANSSFNTSGCLTPGSHGKSLVKPVIRVADDDEEFKSILAAQRRNSRQKGDASGVADMASRKQNNQQTGDASNVADKPVVDSSEDEFAAILAAQKRNNQQKGDASNVADKPVVDGSEDEFAAILAAQKQRGSDTAASDSENSNKNIVVSGGSSREKSSSDLEATSQDSQEETESGGGAQSVATACVKLSADKQSPPSAGNGFSSPAPKRCSPEAASGEAGSAGKRLKRRNVSMYASSGPEEDAC